MTEIYGELGECTNPMCHDYKMKVVIVEYGPFGAECERCNSRMDVDDWDDDDEEDDD